jgi:hypothetical protein
MKTIKSIILVCCALLIFAGCGKDNYPAPNGTIHGALTDAENGGPLQLSEAGSNSSVRMLVNDPAKYPAPQPQDLAVKQDGTYSNSLTFAENYYVFPFNSSGPWQYISNDSVRVSIAAHQDVEVNFKVAPFFYISTPTVTLSSGTVYNVNFTVTKSTVTTVNNDLDNGNANNLLILVSSDPIVNESVASNTNGSHFQNQWQYTVGADIYGVPYNATFDFSAMNEPHGTYYVRVAVVGNNSNGHFNYSPIVKVTL